MVEKIFPSAGMNYVWRISRGASGSSLFTTKKIDLYTSIYSNYKLFIIQDWNDLISCDLHQSVSNAEDHLCGLQTISAQQLQVSQCASIDHMAPLFTHFPSLLFALHLVYEVSNRL